MFATNEKLHGVINHGVILSRKHKQSQWYDTLGLVVL